MKRYKTWIWAAAILVTIILVTGCVEDKKPVVTPIPDKTSEKTPKPTTIVPDTQGIMEKYSLDKLISMSDSIVIGTVLDISSKWSTTDEKKPANVGSNDFIYTDIDIKSEEYLKNPLGTEIITVRVLGGTVGQDTSDVEDQPSFNTGEKILIFLKEDTDPRTKDIGGKHLVVAGLVQGKIVISGNNDVTIGDDKMTLENVRTKIKG